MPITTGYNGYTFTVVYNLAKSRLNFVKQRIENSIYFAFYSNIHIFTFYILNS